MLCLKYIKLRIGDDIVKRLFFTLIMPVIVVLLFCGCDDRAAISSESSQREGMTQNIVGASEAKYVSSAAYREAIELLSMDGMLAKNWGEGGYKPSEGAIVAGKGLIGEYYSFNIISAMQDVDGVIIVDVEFLGNAYIDAKTQMDTTDFNINPILVGGENDYITIPMAKSVVRLKGEGADIEYLSCEFERYETPGHDYLKKNTELMKPVLESSEKIDVSQHDPALVSYFYRKVQAIRLIESPEDLTVYDLQNCGYAISLYDYEFQNYGISLREPVNSSLLKYMTNLQHVDIGVKLTDYSVFNNYEQLYMLTLTGVNDEDIAQLNITADSLNLRKPNIDVLDLSNIRLYSLWLDADGGGGINSFANGGEITDMSMREILTQSGGIPEIGDEFKLLNSISMEYYDSVVDFSSLANINAGAYWNGANISLYGKSLTYEVLESLKDVKIQALSMYFGGVSNIAYKDFDFGVLNELDCRYYNISE